MIGVIDSGIGGLSIVRALHRLRPGTSVAYLADKEHMPYGDASEEDIERWTLGLVHYLTNEHPIRAIVLACNSATSVAADSVRRSWDHPVVAVEPPIKPAAALTRSGKIGVLATRRTASSARLSNLIATHANGCEVLVHPCPGLAEAIENHYPDAVALEEDLRERIDPLLDRGADVITLGCTHYSLVRDDIVALTKSRAQVADPADAVARRILDLVPEPDLGPSRFLATGDCQSLIRAATATTGDCVNVHRLRWKEGKVTPNATY